MQKLVYKSSCPSVECGVRDVPVILKSAWGPIHAHLNPFADPAVLATLLVHALLLCVKHCWFSSRLERRYGLWRQLPNVSTSDLTAFTCDFSATPEMHKTCSLRSQLTQFSPVTTSKKFTPRWSVVAHAFNSPHLGGGGRPISTCLRPAWSAQCFLD